MTLQLPSFTVAAVSSQLRHVSTIEKKPVKHQYLLHASPQYGELRPINGWDRFGSESFAAPSKFQRVRVLPSLLHIHFVYGDLDGGPLRCYGFLVLVPGAYLYSIKYNLVRLCSSASRPDSTTPACNWSCSITCLSACSGVTGTLGNQHQR